jgi:hypothetical protein
MPWRSIGPPLISLKSCCPACSDRSFTPSNSCFGYYSSFGAPLLSTTQICPGQNCDCRSPFYSRASRFGFCGFRDCSMPRLYLRQHSWRSAYGGCQSRRRMIVPGGRKFPSCHARPSMATGFTFRGSETSLIAAAMILRRAMRSAKFSSQGARLLCFLLARRLGWTHLCKLHIRQCAAALDIHRDAARGRRRL